MVASIKILKIQHGKMNNKHSILEKCTKEKDERKKIIKLLRNVQKWGKMFSIFKQPIWLNN